MFKVFIDHPWMSITLTAMALSLKMGISPIYIMPPVCFELKLYNLHKCP
jgi:hypothetical protein